MSSGMDKVLATGAPALVLMAMFLFGGRIHPLRALARSQRVLSASSAGISLAYVFVRLMPDLASARVSFAASTSLPVRFEGMAIYFVALVGFIVFFGLDHFSRKARLALAEGEIPDPGIKILGFAAYACLIGYLLVGNLDPSASGAAAYTFAMAVHCLGFDHRFRDELGDGYARRGHLLLAAAILAGWAAGLLFALPKDVLALMIGFLSGGVIVNAMVGELRASEGQVFVPFAASAIVYSLVLIPLG